MQIDARERGFSYSYDAPLDMRMDPGQELDAREVVNTMDERQLAKVFSTLRRGAQRPGRSHTRSSGAAGRRRSRPRRAVAAVEAAFPAAVRRRFGGSSPAKRVFQAIRILVNDELEDLYRALPAAWRTLAEGGRLAAISFHSLEDRRVKRFLAERAHGCICPPDFPVCRRGRTPEAELITRRAVVATPGEVADNPRSASARLRAARRIAIGEDA